MKSSFLIAVDGVDGVGKTSFIKAFQKQAFQARRDGNVDVRVDVVVPSYEGLPYQRYLYEWNDFFYYEMANAVALKKAEDLLMGEKARYHFILFDRSYYSYSVYQKKGIPCGTNFYDYYVVMVDAASTIFDRLERRSPKEAKKLGLFRVQDVDGLFRGLASKVSQEGKTEGTLFDLARESPGECDSFQTLYEKKSEEIMNFLTKFFGKDYNEKSLLTSF